MKQQIPHKNESDEFIEENRGFIYTAASRICKRKLDWKNDDELSIAMIAFDKACKSYSEKKGNFYSYAGILIKNAIIDFFRKSRNNPSLLFNNDDENLNYIDYKTSMNEFEKTRENEWRSAEIALLTAELSNYKIDFDKLAESSPSHIDTRNELLNVAALCIQDKSIIKYIKEKKILPIKEICTVSKKKRKFIEKWRRYLIALILILSNDDYQYIRSYLNIQ